MFLIGEHKLITLDVIEKEFCCDLEKCKGCCCIEGDAGAPLTDEEIEQIEQALPVLIEGMTPQARAVVEKQGVWYTDPTGDKVTSIINNRECVFSNTDEKECRYCLIEKAYREGRIEFNKPISCHLYPIRVNKVGGALAVEYERWDICHCGRQLGCKLHMPLYKFLKEPLIRRFGEEWYQELERTALEWKKQCEQK